MGLYIKVTGKTIEDAVLEASILLGTTRDNVEYHVIEKESRGFLGIGAKKAMIEARRKTEEKDIIEEVFHEKPAAGKAKSKKSAEPEKKAVKKAEKKEEKAEKGKADKAKEPEKKAEKPEKTKADKAKEPGKKEEKAEKKTEKKAEKKTEKAVKKTEKAAKAENSENAAVTEQAEKEEKKPAPEKQPETETAAVEETSSSAPAAAETESTPRMPADPEVVISRATKFLSEMLSAMGVEAAIRTEYEDGTLNIELEGDDMGVLIGKRGQTLDSIQYLTSLVVNKGKAAYVRVKIDTENYRERRKATLENLAKNMAFKVKKTRRPAYLEPMNPYERRIIHSALQNDPYVTTHSEGDEPTRKVVITLKKREREDLFENEEY